MTLRTSRIWLTPLLAGLLAFPALGFAAAPASRRSRAVAAYKRATEMRDALASRPADTRLKAEYEKVIQTFRSVHWADPAYSKTPVALETVGDLYAEMGRRFSNDYYFRAAIKAYEYLMAEYPNSSMARDAQFAIGDVYLSGLKDEDEARKVFEDYLQKHPRFGKVSEARLRLKKITELAAEREARRSAPPASPPSGSLPQVTDIRHWVGPNYTRIVVSVEGEVKFDTLRLPNPDRIVLDLANSRLSTDLVGKTFPVEDGYLRQVRVGQFQPTVTRVVLDVEKIEDYSIFSLPNPFRLVVDINGPSAKEQVASKDSGEPAAQAPKESEATASKAGPVAAPGSGQETSPSVGAQKSTAAAAVAKKPATDTVADSQPLVKESGEEKKTAKAEAPPPAPAPRSSGAAQPAAPIKAASPTEAGARTLTRALGLKIARIVIDPGHGGHDTGTIGPTGVKEKDVVLDVALKLKKLIEEKAGAEVIMTRSDDTFIPLEERPAIANEKAADLFISIHANASRSRNARGIETYYLNLTSNPEALEVAARENATTQESVHELQNMIKKIAMTEKVEESQDFATEVQREIYSRLKAGRDQRNRGVKKAPFVVLIGANMPSILTEISFLTNPYDERLLKKSDYRERIADALYRGISRYVDKLGGMRAMQQASTLEAPASSATNF